MWKTSKVILAMTLAYSASVANAEIGGTSVPPTILQQFQTDQQTAQQTALQLDLAQSGLVQGGLGSAFQAQGTQPSLAGNTQTIDRRDNLNQSANLANSGSAAAATAGGILTGIGVPMLLSGDIPTQVAGATLLADAATEFAQMGASNGAGNQNQNLSGTLAAASGIGTPATIPSVPILDGKSATALRNAGFNPDQLAQQLASGQVNPQDLLKQYAGNPAVSSEQQQQADNMVTNALSSTPNTIDFGKTPNDTDPSKALTFDDGNKMQTIGMGLKPAAPSGNPPGPSSFSEASQAQHGLRSPGQNPVATELGLDGLQDTAIKNWLTVAVPPVQTEVAARAFLSGQLSQVGVSVPPKGENIFQRAHHQYRNYGRWRSHERVASN